MMTRVVGLPPEGAAVQESPAKGGVSPCIRTSAPQAVSKKLLGRQLGAGGNTHTQSPPETLPVPPKPVFFGDLFSLSLWLSLLPLSSSSSSSSSSLFTLSLSLSSSSQPHPQSTHLSHFLFSVSWWCFCRLLLYFPSLAPSSCAAVTRSSSCRRPSPTISTTSIPRSSRAIPFVLTLPSHPHLNLQLAIEQASEKQGKTETKKEKAYAPLPSRPPVRITLPS